MRWSLQGFEWESNSKHVDDMFAAVETEPGIKGNTDAGHEGDGGDDETSMIH